ncbi:unnamed protein product [Microthlaspi erraticum]|uniref:Uncharacterized protein n=1 Tax=Microthlaspi erraticum TaxID=1685480 RepID=A0A6D2IE72_9BRAS|nr:unnamed protein product [Microthlaspi erraticum]
MLVPLANDADPQTPVDLDELQNDALGFSFSHVYGKARKGLNFNDGDGKGRIDLKAEVVALKDSLSKMEAEKEASLAQVGNNLERLLNLESIGVEVENLKQTVLKLMEDKESSELQYQQCLNLNADLKLKLYNEQEETHRLSSELEEEVAKLKFSEEKCIVLEKSNQNLHS